MDPWYVGGSGTKLVLASYLLQYTVSRKKELGLDRAHRALSIALLKNGIGHTPDIEFSFRKIPPPNGPVVRRLWYKSYAGELNSELT